MLQAEKVKHILTKVKERVQQKLQHDHPYATVSLTHIKNEFGITSIGITILVHKLRDEYTIGRDGTWLIVEKTSEHTKHEHNGEKND